MEIPLVTTKVGPAYATPFGQSFVELPGIFQVWRRLEECAAGLTDARSISAAFDSDEYQVIPDVLMAHELIGADRKGLVYRLLYKSKSVVGMPFAVKLYGQYKTPYSPTHSQFRKFMRDAKPSVFEPLIATKRVLAVSYNPRKVNIAQKFELE